MPLGTLAGATASARRALAVACVVVLAGGVAALSAHDMPSERQLQVSHGSSGASLPVDVPDTVVEVAPTTAASSPTTPDEPVASTTTVRTPSRPRSTQPSTTPTTATPPPARRFQAAYTALRGSAWPPSRPEEDRGALMIVRTGDTEPRVLASGTLRPIGFVRGGTVLLYQGWTSGEIWSMPVDGGTPRHLADGSEATVSPDGSMLAWSDGVLRVQRLKPDGDNVALDGLPVAVMPGGYDPTFSGDGRHLMFHLPSVDPGVLPKTFFVADAPAFVPVVVPIDPTVALTFLVRGSLSHDGSRLAFASRTSHGQGSCALVDRLGVVKQVPVGGFLPDCVWSPVRDELAVGGDRSFVLTAGDTETPIELPRSGNGSNGYTAWTPDGEDVVWQSSPMQSIPRRGGPATILPLAGGMDQQPGAVIAGPVPD